LYLLQHESHLLLLISIFLFCNMWLWLPRMLQETRFPHGSHFGKVKMKFSNKLPLFTHSLP
ncbi:hypothetical protein ACJX0J_035282, partial [Zea mays]